MLISIINEFMEVSIERPEVETATEAVQTCFYALTALGYSAGNIAEAFVEIGEEYCGVLGLND